MTKFQLNHPDGPWDYPALGFRATDGAILDGTLFDPEITDPPDAWWSVYGGGSAQTGITSIFPYGSAGTYVQPTDNTLPIYKRTDRNYRLLSPADWVAETEVAAALSAAYVGRRRALADARHAFGDSLTDGTGASVPANKYVNVLAALMGWGSVVNHGVGGDQAYDQSHPVFAQIIANDTESTLAIGTNDFRTYGTSVVLREVFRRAHLALAAWLAIPAADKIAGQDGTPTGTWSVSGAYSADGLNGVSSETAGNTVSFAVYGRTAYLCSIHQGGNTSTYQVEVDGRVIGVYSTAPAATATTVNGDTYGPNLHRIPGLTDGAHTVTIRVVTASAGNPVYAIWAAGSDAGAAAETNVAVATIARFTAAGYTSFGGSDAVNAAYNTVVRRNVAALQADGLNVTLADVAAAIDPAVDIGGDGVHWDDSGHAAAAAAFAAALDPLPSSSQRRVGPIEPAFVGCRLTNSGGYSIPTGGFTAVPWDAETFDSHGFHSLTANTSRITIPAGQAGYYLLTACVPPGGLSDATRYVVRLRLNGSDLPASAEASSGGNFIGVPISIPVYLAEGDYVEAATYNGGGSTALDTALAHFAAAKLGI